jgi:hypothetical protein
MAEFQEVMRRAKRMCKAQHNCYECPANVICNVNECHKRISCVASISDYKNVERIVMNWAAENPEPRYPSWREVWKQLFPDGQRTPCPGRCGKKYAPEWCGQEECGECKNRPIPADIAKKLGIKPIGGNGND